MNLGIKAKLLCLLVIMSVLMVVIGGIGLAGFRENNLSLKNIYEDNMKGSSQLTRIDGLIRASRIQMLLALQHDPQNEFSALHDHPTGAHTELAQKNIDEISRTWSEFYAHQKSEETRQLADAFSKELTAYEKEGLEPAMKAVLANDFTEAYRITFDAINPSVKKANQAMDALMKHEVALAQTAHETAVAHMAWYRNIILVSIVIALICGGALGFLTIRSISASSAMLRDVASHLAGGNLSARAAILSRDELGEISQCFNQIADTFQALVEQVESSAHAVSDAAGSLRANAEQIASGSEHVAGQAVTVAAAGEEMAATSMGIAATCGKAAENANRACTTATNGTAIVQKTVDGMNRIAAKVQDTARAVENLGVRSDQIGNIIGTIEDIADQTNLLALNAAIEAARAGEQGRGFAVVADEVRALAERTTRATREIGEMIKAVQNETKGAVAAMEEGVLEVENGTEDAARSGGALTEILKQITEVTGQIDQIATAAEEQTATTNEISNNIQRITDVVKETADSSQTTAEAATRLLNLADELTAVVSRFRLAR
ncbi:methyl-accepting chemotaxis protein [Geobacter sp. AOG2]|uniref:methyl-accepting chemotaxis protein n=1 Tax=Geobacter sp. AOG2 TaxID=1566347 RepID=UPI001CC64E8F|nr:methyl-accepting chemotaxis protein [Geobacter sp. AOG2]GFE61865.1 methyl-accepting chemotaxis protein [Geobacter sp. AOG2]